MKKLISFLIVVSVVVFGINYLLSTSLDPDIAVGNSLETQKPVVTPTPIGEPLKLIVPSLEINTTIEHVGADETGNMDVPKEDENVAWWMHGPKPGEIGSAVLAGHFDTKLATPAVFYDLESLVIGDTVEVKDENDKSLKFEVVDIKTYKDEDFPIAKVFDQNDTKRLNLITCAGTFDRGMSKYLDRLVVFTILVED